ncbi:hypothetical protein BASA81_010660 [Batrachochytrium salamandrivorans]|nr:hypothetical protein BASA81_010660 [Batrachochytrium salamandrivorans]
MHGARFRITVPEDRQRNIIHRVLWYGGVDLGYMLHLVTPGLEREWSGAIEVTVGATPSSWIAGLTSAAMSDGGSTAGVQQVPYQSPS